MKLRPTELNPKAPSTIFLCKMLLYFFFLGGKMVHILFMVCPGVRTVELLFAGFRIHISFLKNKTLSSVEINNLLELDENIEGGVKEKRGKVC